MTSPAMVARQLLAIRDLVDNALEMLGASEVLPSGGPCAHPVEQRKPAGVMGAPDQFLCGVCHMLVNPGA